MAPGKPGADLGLPDNHVMNRSALTT